MHRAPSRTTPPSLNDPNLGARKALGARERWSRALDVADLAPFASHLAPLVRSAIALETRDPATGDHGVGASRLGGAPDLPAAVPWPGAPAAPMLFVAQLNLTQLAPYDTDALLPREGILAFFTRWHDDGWCGAVIATAGAPLVPRETPLGLDVAPLRGVDFGVRVELPPYASHFVGIDDATLRPTRFDPATATWSRPPPLVALPVAAHVRYGEAYGAWRAETGFPAHGLLGYDRAMECEQSPEETLLLRLDAAEDVGHDFLEAACLYFLIDRQALARRAFAAARAHYGASL